MLAILTTHPIQYQVPLWQALSQDGRVPFEVWYLTDHGTRPSRDPEFGRTFAWDIDTLSGYPYRFLAGAKNSTPTSFAQCRLREPLRARLRSSGATALWIQGWQVAAYWQAVREARHAGVELWLRGESNDLGPQPRWKRPLKSMQLNWLFRRIDRFLCIGTANRRLYRNFGAPSSRLYHTPYAVDNDRFARQAAVLRPERSELRRRWAIPEDAFCVLFCGKFVPKKRPFDIIAAARILQTENALRKVHLLFVGDGALGADLQRSCNVAFDAQAPHSRPMSNLPAPAASFTGFLNQTEISRAYVAADCLVLPSDHGETWGLVVNEALASELPCLASNACGCAEDLLGPPGSFPLANVSELARMLKTMSEHRPTTIMPQTISETVSTLVDLYSEAHLRRKYGLRYSDSAEALHPIDWSRQR
jgi:glycosyltransferase involved in cell wall biosynthesis